MIETRGIEPVPDGERHGRPRDLFWTWAGANLGVLGITLGAALVTFTGLDVPQAILVTVLGAGGSFLLVGLLSTAGVKGGAPGLTLSRAVFGVRGNLGPTLVSWLGFVGWETVMCTTAAYALTAVLGRAGIAAGTGTTAACVLASVLIAAVIGLFGHATILWLQKWLTWIFGALTLVVAAFLLGHVDLAAAWARPAGPLSAVVAGTGFIAAGTGLGWLAAGPDYTRYLPRRTPGARIVGATVLGSGLPLLVLISLGALLATGDDALAAANDPVAAIGAALPGWMLVPYLLTAVAGLIAAADLSMYSSGLNLLAGGVRIRRTMAVGVDAVLIVAGGLYVTVVAQDFFGPFTTFLTVLAVPLCAWAGVFLADQRTRREYDPDGLLATSAGSPYWYSGGVHLKACLSWIVALVAGFAGGPAGWLIAGLTGAVLYSVLPAKEKVVA